MDLPIRTSHDAFNVRGVPTVKMELPASLSILQLKLFFAKRLSIPYNGITELDNRLVCYPYMCCCPIGSCTLSTLTDCMLPPTTQEFRCAREELSSSRMIAEIAKEVLGDDHSSLLLLKYHVWASASDHAEAAAAIQQQQSDVQHNLAPHQSQQPSSESSAIDEGPVDDRYEEELPRADSQVGISNWPEEEVKLKQQLVDDNDSCNETDEADTCRICFDALDGKSGRTVVQLAGCSHKFHLDCLGSFFNSAGGQMICPLCRATEEEQWLYSETKKE